MNKATLLLLIDTLNAVTDCTIDYEKRNKLLHNMIDLTNEYLKLTIAHDDYKQSINTANTALLTDSAVRTQTIAKSIKLITDDINATINNKNYA